MKRSPPTLSVQWATRPVNITLFLVGLILFAPKLLHAQPTAVQFQAASLGQLTPLAQVPAYGNFWLLTRPNLPLPGFTLSDYNPPVFDVGSGNFIIDDREIDWAAIEAYLQSTQSGTFKGGFSRNDPETGDSEVCTSGLFLRFLSLTATNLHLGIDGAETNGIYDLYWTAQLGTTNPWVYLGRTDAGQTNLLLTPGESLAGFFILGTLYDQDGDSLPNAFENLVSHTDPAMADAQATLGAPAFSGPPVMLNGNPSNLTTNTPLLTELSSGLQVYHVHDDRNYVATWSPCPNNGDAETTHQVADWHQGSNGILVCNFTNRWCSNGVEIAHSASGSYQFDGSQADRVKLSWHLAEALTGTNITSFDWSAETKVQWFTGGLLFSSKQWPWIIHGTADNLVPTWDANWQISNSIPSTNITVAGKTLDTNGDAVIIWSDNTANECTPSIAGFDKYKYDVNATRVRIPLDFLANGPLTQRETDGKGYQVDRHHNATNITESTILGVGNPPAHGYWFNFEETDATVPRNSDFDVGWQWHQDISFTTYKYVQASGGSTGALFVLESTNFSATVGEGDGNDDRSIVDDPIPDLNRLVLTSDSPGIRPLLTYDPNVDVVLACRHYARQWLTWNGVQASDIKKWRSFTTIRERAGGNWERAGQNLLGTTPIDDRETPEFTELDGSQVLSEP